MVYQGTYASSTNYALNDAVTYQASTYISLTASNLGNTPSSSPAKWSVLAAAGAAGAAGATGTTGPQGATGATGATGAAGTNGTNGATGAAGAPGLTWQGTYASTANYALNDAVTYNGSSYISLIASNHGNTPTSSPTAWSLLAAAGSAGTPGATGATGAAGTTGAAGAAGATGAAGPTGATGAVGMNFRGAWVSGTEYAVNDAVTFGTPTSTYLAAIAALSSSSNQPDISTETWTVLAQAGGAGPTGAQGTAATVSVGTTTTGEAGTSASVTSSGSSSALVLNFTIPQGATGATGSGGSGGGGGTSGIPFASMYHSVIYTTYVSVNNANSSTTASTAELTWVPAGCTATALNVYSQQGQTITVSLRVGTPGSMTTTALTCTAMPNGSGGTCPVTGSVSVPVGDFVDLEISNANSTPAGVWTALTCN
jgi:hypothetical protein